MRRQLRAADEHRVAIRLHGGARQVAHLVGGDLAERDDVRGTERVHAGHRNAAVGKERGELLVHGVV